MRSGKLKRLVTIQRAMTTLNDYGTPASTWSEVATLRAEVEPVSTEEFIRGFGATEETLVIFRTRHLEGVTTADRVGFEGRFFNIKQVVDHGRPGGLELRAVEDR